MVFTSITFLLFFLTAFLILYYAVPARFLRARNAVAFLFSIAFYACGGVGYLFLLLFSVAANYGFGAGIGRSRGKRAKKAFLAAAVVVNVGLLGVFKYAGFVTSSLASVISGFPVLKTALPIGISFYTFQGMSYVFDVYSGSVGWAKNPLTVGLYISLFPQLVAGPIVRYADIESEIGERSFSSRDFASGAVRFMFGLGKKAILANSVGEIADGIFNRGGYPPTAPEAWLGAAAFALQIYLDFSSYSDMAIGLGQMIGFHFKENFDYPYDSLSVTEFWRRWHMSLSTWFRDYVYIPLGGNRRGPGRQIFNLMVVWTLTGIWHGANWTFILWGVYYGVLLIIEKFLIGKRLGKIPAPVRYVGTAVAVLIGWVLFRSASISEAWEYLRSMFGASGGSLGECVYYVKEYALELAAAVLASVVPWRRIAKKLSERPLPAPVASFLPYGAAALAFLVFGIGYMRMVSGSFTPFIYFQF